MPILTLPSLEETLIVLRNENNEVVGQIDALDAFDSLIIAQDEAEKFGKDRWEVYRDTISSKYGIDLPGKTAAVILYTKATEILEDVKKKSSELLKQSGSSGSHQENTENENS